jgi:hypothetical protein
MTALAYLQIKVLCGLIVFESHDIGKVLKQFYAHLCETREHDHRPELCVVGLIHNDPEFGQVFCCLFLWASSDLEQGEKYHRVIRGFGNPVVDTVKETTAREWLQFIEGAVPSGVHGGVRTVSVRQMTDSVIDVIGESLPEMATDPSTSLAIQELRGPSTRDDGSSFFINREEHFLLELVGSVQYPENLQKAQSWIQSLYSKLSSEPDALALRYIALSPTDTESQRAAYGDKWEELRSLKRKYDPSGRFNLSVPRIQ